MTHGKNKLRKCRDCGSERMRCGGACNLSIEGKKCKGTMQVVKDDRRR